MHSTLTQYIPKIKGTVRTNSMRSIVLSKCLLTNSNLRMAHVKQYVLYIAIYRKHVTLNTSWMYKRDQAYITVIACPANFRVPPMVLSIRPPKEFFRERFISIEN